MFDSKPPAPGAAIHVLKNQRGRKLFSYCGQDITGERELPEGTAPTCPTCTSKAPRA